MSTKLIVSLALALGLSACITDLDDVDEDTQISTDDQDQIATDPSQDIVNELTGDPTDPNVPAGTGNQTCGGKPRLKADGPCLPN
jgi:hypothetical protein